MKKDITSSVTKVVEVAEGGIKSIEKTVDSVASPVRESLIKRFPILFTLIVTFGVAMTFLGFEQVMLKITLFQENPFSMLGIGVIILVLTGTLYKKLG